MLDAASSQFVTLCAFVPAVLVLFEAVARRVAAGARDEWKWHAAALSWLAVFAVALLAAPPAGPIHNHGTFVARTECGAMATCASGWSWLAPGLDAWAAFVGLWPALSSTAMAGASITSAFAALALAYVLPLSLWDGARGRWVGLGALAAIILQPAFVRVAAGATPYPFVTAALLGSGVCAVAAVRRRSAIHAAAAGVLLGVASFSNFVCLALAPLLVLVPFSWRPDRDSDRKRRALLGFAVAVGFGVILLAAASDLARVVNLQGQDPTQAVAGVLSQLPFRPRELPLGIAALWFVGLACVRDRRTWPLFYAYGVLTFFFCGTVEHVETEYPTRFVHSSMAMVPTALIAGLGVGVIAAWGAPRGPRRVALAVSALLVAVLLTVPLASQATRFFGESFVITAEYAHVDAALTALPEHDLLVVPAPVREHPEYAANGDPVEVNFPYAAYRTAYEAQHGRTVEVVHLRDFLEGRASEDQRVHFYLGSNVVSWVPSEIAAGAVPEETYERPALIELREIAALEPVDTARIATEQPALATQRLAADREPAVELGFYEVQLRDGETRDDAEYEHGAGGGRTPDGRARFSIGPGREEDILALFAEPELPGGWTLERVSIERFEIRGELAGPSDQATLVLSHPLNTDAPVGETASFAYRWEASTEAGAEAGRALASAVERNDNGRFWPRSER